MAAAKTVLNRDLNDYRSGTIVHWACATREILFRVANGLDLDQPVEVTTTGGNPLDDAGPA